MEVEIRERDESRESENESVGVCWGSGGFCLLSEGEEFKTNKIM